MQDAVHALAGVRPLAVAFATVVGVPYRGVDADDGLGALPPPPIASERHDPAQGNTGVTAVAQVSSPECSHLTLTFIPSLSP